MSISMEQVKELREMTGAGILDCKNALVENSGSIEKASEFLRKKGLAKAAKKSGRSTKDGQIFSYIHGAGKIGVLVEINCETDFVARTDDFQQLCRDISMHIAAASPAYVKREDVPTNLIEKEQEIFQTQAKESGKPEQVIEKIVAGKIDKYFSEICLLEQSFVKDPDKNISDVLKESIAKLGENITVARFARFGLGESTSHSSSETSE